MGSLWDKTKLTYRQRKRASKIDARRKNKEAMDGDVNRLTASDEIESEYGYRYGTSFHKAVIDRLKRFKEVSSPNATNRRATTVIYLSWIGKILSIYMTYVSVLYLYQQGLQTQLEIPFWMSAVFIFGLAIVIEWMSGAELKAMFNTTEKTLTRLVGLGVGVILTAIGLYIHIWYQDLQFVVSTATNSQKVLQIDTPATKKIKSQIKTIESSIKYKEQELANSTSLAKSTISDFDEQITELKYKRDFYKKVLEELDSKKRSSWKKGRVRYTKLNGKATKVASIPNYIRYRDSKIAEIQKEKAKVQMPNSPELDRLKAQKMELENDLEKAYDEAKDKLDDASQGSGHAGLLFQLFITFLAKIDVYGYFLLRANIKNHVLDKMHKIIDDFNAMHQLSGVLDQFSRMVTQQMKGIALTGISINNEIAGVNRTITTTANRHILANERLRMALEQSKASDIESNYQTIGDERVDISGEPREEDSLGIEEREKILTEYVRSMGYTHNVILDSDVDIGSTIGNIIRLNPNLSDEDTVKAIVHELAHFESGTYKHNQKYEKGVDKVMKKKKTFEFSKVKKRDYPFSAERALEILSAYSLSVDIRYGDAEIEYFISRDAWRDNKLEIKDYLHLLNILDI